MGLKATVASLDGLSDAVKQFYVQREGKYVLDVEPSSGYELSDVQGLKSALQKERGIVSDLEKRLRPFEGLTTEDLDKYKAGDSRFKDADGKIKALQTELEKEQAKRKQALTQLEKVSIESVAIQELSKKAPKSVALLLPHVMSRAKLRESEDGRVSVVILDDAGQPAINGVKDGQIQYMGVADYVDKMAKDEGFALAFNGSGASGNGATGGNNGNVSGVRKYTREELKNPATYRQAAAEAQKAGTNIQTME